MNAIEILSLQPWVGHLGWTLVQFLWQGASIAVLYLAIRSGIAAKASPNTHYLMACGALAAMMAAPLLTWGLLGSSDSSPHVVHPIGRVPAAAAASSVGAAGIVTLPAAVRDTVSGARQTLFLPWVVVLWLVGAAAFWLRLAGGWVMAYRMRSMLVRRAPPEWQEILRNLGLRIGLSRPVQLLVSAMVQVPMVVGWLRPVVLLPVGVLGGLPAEQLEALLLHELAHIRRHDYLVNILQSVAEALLFYHPAVWWVSGHIRAERELCCDDVAVSVSGDALTYARALVQLESSRPAHLDAAVAASGGSLPDRIARLLGQARPAVRSGVGPGVVALAIVLMAAAYGVLAQTAARPAFQSVSIRRSAFQGNQRAQHAVGMGVNSPLMLLIQFAYATHSSPYAGHTIPLPASQVVGGPPWIDNEAWDIVTKSRPNNVTGDWPMWQMLLADRFKLRLHREIKELPIYVMTAAASGFKLPAPSKDLGCVSFPAGTKPHQVPGKVDCGYVSGPGSDGMRGRKVHMADLISELALSLDRPISDRTGFTDEFDVNLHFVPDQALQGFGFGPPVAMPPAGRNLPNVFEALEQQLGLKLAPGKGPVEVLVIDHVEKPAEN